MASSVIGEALVLVRPELTKFGNELKEGIGTAVSKTESESSSAFNKLAGVGKAAFLGIAGAAVGFGAEAINAALKGQEATAQLANAVKQAGGNWDQLKGHVEEVTDGYAKFGITNDEAEAGLTRLVQITNNVGESEKLLATAANVAAARHIDLTTAANLVGRAAEGNISPLKRMGIIVEDTGSKAGNAEAAIKLLNERFGGAAQAQADTYAGKLKAFKAETENLTEKVGNALLPVLAGLAGDLADVVGFFEKNRAAALLLAGVVGGPLVAAVGAYLVQEGILVVAKTADFLETVAIASLYAAGGLRTAAVAAKDFVGSMVAALGPVELAAAAVGLLTGAITLNTTHTKEAKDAATAYVQGLKGSGDEVTILKERIDQLSKARDQQFLATERAATSEGTWQKVSGHARAVYDQQTAAIDVLRDRVKELSTAHKGAAEATGDLAAAQEKAGRSADDLAARFGISTQLVGELADKLKIDLTKATDEQTTSLGAMVDRLRVASPQTLDLRDAIAKLSDQTADAKEKVSAFKTALDILIGGNIDAEKAVVNFYGAIDQLGAKIRANNTDFDAHTKAGRDNITMVEDSVVAIRNHIEAMQNQGFTADQIRAAFDGDTESLRKQLEQSGLTKAQIDKLIATYNLVPASLNTVITADTDPAQKAWNDLMASAQPYLNALSKLSDVQIRGAAGAIKLPGFDEGGWVPGAEGRPQLAVVHGGEFVLSRDMLAGVRSGPAGGGSGAGGVSVSVSITMPGLATSPEAVALIRSTAQGEFASAVTRALDAAAAGAGSRAGG